MLSEIAAAGRAVCVLAIAGTDSYLKWSGATLDALPTSWRSAQLLIENPMMPSAAQMQAACACRVEVLSHAEVVRRIRRECQARPHRHPYRSRRLGVVFVGECVGRGVQLADGSWALLDLTPAPVGQR